MTLIPSSIDNNSDDKRARLLVKLAESQIFSNLKKPHNEHLESGERCGPAVWVRGRGGCVHEADYHGREAILFVVDANLQTAGVERLLEALNIIRTAFISGLLVNDKDLIGLIFANTKHSPPPLEASALTTS